MNEQTISLWGEDVPVSKLCGWGVWKSDTEFDYAATKDVVREQFNLWTGDEGLSNIYKKLHVYGAAPYKAGQRMMLWEIGRKLIGGDVDNIAQEVGDPFQAGTMVLMADGSEKKIEDMQIGDIVLNHKCEKAKVTRVIKRIFTGNLITIKLRGQDRTLTATAIHHGMVLPDGEYPYRNPQRVKFGDLVVGQFMLIPMGSDGNNTPYGITREISSITENHVNSEKVYCITTENEYTAIFNGIAQYQCVSWGGRNAVAHCQFGPIANGQRDVWTDVFPPYLWGCGRVFIGNNQLGREDGSLGVWQAKAVMEYGAVPMKYEGIPKYSGSVARAWGNKPGPDKKWIDMGKQHIVKSAAAVLTWEDFVTALTNLYPVGIASNVGFDMTPRADGFHHYSTHWGHMMCLVGVDDDASEPYGCIRNSWGCFSKDTEILTEIGWMLFQDLPKGLKVATLNPNNHQLEYQEPFGYFEYDYHGALYNFRGRDIDQLVTSNHRIYHRPMINQGVVQPWRMRQVDDLILNFEMKKDCEWTGTEVPYYYVGEYEIPMDDWLEFLGYFLSEGYTTICKRTLVHADGRTVNHGYSRRTGICQMKSENFDKIQKCVDRLPFKSNRVTGGWVFAKKALYEELHSLGKAHEKYIPSYVKDLSRRQQRILFDALMVGDGSYSQCPTGEKVTYYTSSKRLADDMQELLLKIGYAGDISQTDRIGREQSNGVTRHIEYRVGIKRTALTPNKEGGWKPILVPYDGKVYCVSVPNEIIFVRRNGRACWSGNSVHGDVKDFKTGETWPPGTLRVRKKDIETILSEKDSFAYSAFEGFPAQELDRDKFDLW